MAKIIDERKLQLLYKLRPRDDRLIRAILGWYTKEDRIALVEWMLHGIESQRKNRRKKRN